MSTLAVVNALASVFVPIGMTGAAIALACALIAAVALARAAAGLAGGAIGVWIVGAMLSLAASFADVWTPSVLSLAALGTALIAGPVVRLLARILGARSRREAGPTAQVTAAPMAEGIASADVPRPASAPVARPRETAPARPSAPMTGGMRAVA